MPRLKALDRHWARHPPTHVLVAAYLGYEQPDDLEPPRASPAAGKSADTPPDATQLAQMAGMGSIPASDDLRNAQTSMDGLAAVERMFFGTLVEL